jgi:hypothetical protein
MIKFPIGNDDTARKIGINGFNNTIAAGNCAKKYLPYRNALNNGKMYGANATTRSGTGTILNPPPEYPLGVACGTNDLVDDVLRLASTTTPRVVVVVAVVVAVENASPRARRGAAAAARASNPPHTARRTPRRAAPASRLARTPGDAFTLVVVVVIIIIIVVVDLNPIQSHAASNNPNAESNWN